MGNLETSSIRTDGAEETLCYRQTFRADGALRHLAQALLCGPKPTINAFEVTLERLGSAIKMGLYEPGERLPSEREIANLMGISRATVREAIRLLTEQGVLYSKRGRRGGTFVANTLPPESVMNLRQRLQSMGVSLEEILDHRLVVETGVAELAAQRAEAEQIQELQFLVNEMANTQDYGTYRKLDIKFHLLVARTTQTNRLPALVAEVHAEFSDLLMAAPYSLSQCLHSTAQHRAIVEAIRNRDPVAARSLMQEHILATNSFLMGLL